MTQPVLSVLVLCTGNSARSIMAEYILNAAGQGRIRAYSAGSKPTGAPNPFALARLEKAGFDPSDARSKSWDEFAAPDAPSLDMVITVCDSAAAETCPYWPGAPLRLHWGLPDPAGVTGTDDAIAAAFDEAFGVISRRVDAMIALLPLDKADATLQARLQDIGKLP